MPPTPGTSPETTTPITPNTIAATPDLRDVDAHPQPTAETSTQLPDPEHTLEAPDEPIISKFGPSATPSEVTVTTVPELSDDASNLLADVSAEVEKNDPRISPEIDIDDASELEKIAAELRQKKIEFDDAYDRLLDAVDRGNRSDKRLKSTPDGVAYTNVTDVKNQAHTPTAEELAELRIPATPVEAPQPGAEA